MKILNEDKKDQDIGIDVPRGPEIKEPVEINEPEIPNIIPPSPTVNPPLQAPPREKDAIISRV